MPRTKSKMAPPPPPPHSVADEASTTTSSGPKAKKPLHVGPRKATKAHKPLAREAESASNPAPHGSTKHPLDSAPAGSCGTQPKVGIDGLEGPGHSDTQYVKEHPGSMTNQAPMAASKMLTNFNMTEHAKELEAERKTNLTVQQMPDHPLAQAGRTGPRGESAPAWDRERCVALVIRRLQAGANSTTAACEAPYVDEQGKEWPMVPAATIRRWQGEDPAIFDAFLKVRGQMTLNALERLSARMEDDSDDVFTDSQGRTHQRNIAVQRQTLQFKALSWMAERLIPQLANRAEIHHSGSIDTPERDGMLKDVIQQGMPATLAEFKGEETPKVDGRFKAWCRKNGRSPMDPKAKAAYQRELARVMAEFTGEEEAEIEEM